MVAISAPKWLTLSKIFKNCPKLLGGYRHPAPRSRRNLPHFADCPKCCHCSVQYIIQGNVE